MATVAEIIVETAQRYGVDPRLAVEVAIQESGMHHLDRSGNVVRGSSGEIGVFQLLPATAASLGVDPYNLQQNIEGGVRYLKQQLVAFGWNPAKALAAYNCGPGCVANAIAAAGADWLSRVPASTRTYVNTILARLGEWAAQPGASVQQMVQAAENFRLLSREQQAVLLVLAIVLGVLFTATLVDA
ncbi:MAG: transglycosylase SLT domain-containing protein [Acidobacteria bacterium]|nr:transglycosylase SLT domain-containing protein [Acidobacteriota bacterium]